MSNAKPKTARSYRGTVVDDNAVVSINLKWLGQMFVLVAGLVYSYYMVIQRITDLERRMEVADNTVTELVENYQVQEDIKFAKMEEELNWYQKELNLNPLSWRKKSKKR
tara:strand:+ start:288 stop:614 length:327 start_codon:yes stop_codon:yes gene_type:complete